MKKLSNEDYLPVAFIAEIIAFSDRDEMIDGSIQKIIENLKRFSIRYLVNKTNFSSSPRGAKLITKLEFSVFCSGESIKIEDLMRREPTDEESFVGLFCLSFPLLKQQKIKIVKNKQELVFDNLELLQEKFPDAEIELKDCNPKTLKPIHRWKVEFEFLSSRYITHKHHQITVNETNKEGKIISIQPFCEAIICWKDDLRDDDFVKFKGLPPVLSFEKLLMEGDSQLRGLR
jgi:hypothetical protein